MYIDRLAQLGYTLPPAPKPIGAYVPAVRGGNMLFLSGQLPLIDGKLPAEFTGKLGFNVSVENAQQAATQATLNALAIIQDAVGLEHVRRIVRLAGYLSTTPTFTQHPQVMNAASSLLHDVFGDAGIHARLALAAPVLPLDACVELELIVEVSG